MYDLEEIDNTLAHRKELISASFTQLKCRISKALNEKDSCSS